MISVVTSNYTMLQTAYNTLYAFGLMPSPKCSASFVTRTLKVVGAI